MGSGVLSFAPQRFQRQPFRGLAVAGFALICNLFAGPTANAQVPVTGPSQVSSAVDASGIGAPNSSAASTPRRVATPPKTATSNTVALSSDEASPTTAKRKTVAAKEPLETSTDALPTDNVSVARDAGALETSPSPPDTSAVVAPKELREPRVAPGPRVAPAATAGSTTAPAPTVTEATTATTTSDTSSETTTSNAAPTIGVTYLNKAVFLIANDGTKNSKERARRLSEALKAAIEAPEKATLEAHNVDLVMQVPPGLELQVRGYGVGSLTKQDASAAGYQDLESYAKALDDGLELFIADQRRKMALQGFAVRVAIALLVSIIGLFMLRGAQSLFRRADEYLDEHSSSIRPIRVLGVPVLGVEALSAALTFALAIGRIVALASIAAVTVAIGLAQFDYTRPWIAVIVEWSSARLFNAIEEFVLMLPRLFLAALLILIGSAAVRVARVLFDDSTTTATPWGTVSRRRAKVLKFLIPVGVFVLVVPLAVAAVFGRFHTPLELLIIALVVGASLGLAPLVASGGMGLAATWHGTLQLGDHITVGQKSGRVSGVNPFWVNLETHSGELCSVPLLSLVNTPVLHRSNTAFERIELRIQRPTDIPAALELLRVLALEASERASIECLGFNSEQLHVAIDVAASPRQTADLIVRLADPQFTLPVLELTRMQYPDMVRGPS